MRAAPILLLLAPLCATTPAVADGGSDREAWEAWYCVRAQARSARLEADLEAGGRLAMAGRRKASGALALSLLRVLEHPWKLYRVDPAGPFGDELKVASVVTLPEASWQALADAEVASRIDGAERHRRWLETADRPRELDGTFAFVVIGVERHRFRIEVSPDGPVSSVSNTLTDRWLSGPFDQFVGTWGTQDRGAAPDAGPAPEGYWFWNRGEDAPLSYEPHTYDAFVAALELLSLPLPPCCLDSAVNQRVTWDAIGARATRVLSTLAPRLGSTPVAKDPTAATNLDVALDTLADGSRRLTLSTASESSGPQVERLTVFSALGRPMSDQIRIRFSAITGASLEVEAGYRPREAKKELK